MTAVSGRPRPEADRDAGEPAARRRFVLIVDRAPDAVLFRPWEWQAVVLPEVGLPYTRVRFDRPAPTMAGAVTSAVRALESAGCRVLRVDTDDYVTVWDVAHRTGRSRTTVRRWVAGRAGPGGFPPPLNPRRDTTFYSWAETLPWLRHELGVDLPEEDPTRVAADLALRLRSLLPRVPASQAVLDLLA